MCHILNVLFIFGGTYLRLKWLLKLEVAKKSVELNWAFNIVTSLLTVQRIGVMFFMLVGLTWRNSQCWGHTHPWGSVAVIVLLP
jgi:hypothetical protein